MVLSAGAGLRMRPLTEHTPKPLLKAGGRCLIEYHLENLKHAGIKNVIINTSYCAEQFVEKLGNGTEYDLNIRYSHEADKPLETGGGILKALPLIESDSFVVVSADVWTDFRFDTLKIPKNSLGILVLVNNPDHHLKGDFLLIDGMVRTLDDSNSQVGLTYSGISMLRKSLFRTEHGEVFPLRTVFHEFIDQGVLAGRHYEGQWQDIGTPDRLDQLDFQLRHTSHE